MRDVVEYVKYLLCVVESKLFKDLNYVPICLRPHLHLYSLALCSDRALSGDKALRL